MEFKAGDKVMHSAQGAATVIEVFAHGSISLELDNPTQDSYDMYGEQSTGKRWVASPQNVRLLYDPYLERITYEV